MRANYHTHTARCHHASGADADYVEAAIQAGYNVLGFSDHCPWPFKDWFTVPVRMDWDELPGYIQSIRALGEAHKKQLTVLCGLECEYFPQHLSTLEEMASQTDYLILGQHYDTTADVQSFIGDRPDLANSRKYLELCVEGLSTGLFSCIAHPDIFLLPFNEFSPELASMSRYLCRAARSMGIPLELNLYGVRKQVRQPWAGYPSGLGYPCPAFWRIAAQEGCTAIIGVDAHTPDALRDPELPLMAAMYLDALGIERVEQLRLGNKL
ncbi:MAG: histidinol-phosphatase [Oscillospiraceae bacterium]|jgi:histidinol-phosphatase (PHP family)|nr:histidinol-phosphatase [Oscillospiraceae bacterium]